MAPDRSAEGEAACGIHYTPDEAAARARTDPYLDWVWQGLASAGVSTVEVFPRAAWTRWLGPRGDRSRLRWARDGMERLRTTGLRTGSVRSGA